MLMNGFILLLLLLGYHYFFGRHFKAEGNKG
jgi:hypothetical protein